MSIVYSQTAINARLQAVITTIDSGAGNGTLKVLSAISQILSTITLSKPSGTVAAGVLTFSGTPLVDPNIAITGNPTQAVVQDSNGNTVISGLTVGITGTEDIVISSSRITAGDDLALLSATITGT